MNDTVTFQPLQLSNWEEFAELFGEKGACEGCWCQYWKLKRSTYNEDRGEANKQRMKVSVDSGEQLGIMAFKDNKAIGWIAFGPRNRFSALERSRILKPVDDKEVWSIVCFFTHKNHRKQGLSSLLLQSVVDYCKNLGIQILEGYPTEPHKGKTADAFVWTGLSSPFLNTGFKEVARRSPHRPVMRYYFA